jgi:hypothetical protein
MELGERNFLFQEWFLDKIKSFSEDLSSLEINLASCYWSKDLVEVIDLLQTQGFRISGLYVPDALLEISRRLLNNNNTPATTNQPVNCRSVRVGNTVQTQCN